jgi:hypothetical protein
MSQFMSVLLWIEESALSVWVRESSSLFAFPFILFLHTLGLALLAGVSVGIDFWLLTVATRMPRVSMKGLFHVMWLGFGINAVSGVILLIAYPAKALTNVVFYVKMLLVVLALIALEALKKETFAAVRPGDALVVTQRAKALAIATLLLWGGTIFTGRFLAYTHTILMATDPPFAR